MVQEMRERTEGLGGSQGAAPVREWPAKCKATQRKVALWWVGCWESASGRWEWSARLNPVVDVWSGQDEDCDMSTGWHLKVALVRSERAGLMEGKVEGCLQLGEGRVGGEEMEKTSVGNSVVKFGCERQQGAQRAVAGGYLAHWQGCVSMFLNGSQPF